MVPLSCVVWEQLDPAIAGSYPGAVSQIRPASCSSPTGCKSQGHEKSDVLCVPTEESYLIRRIE